MRLGDRLGKSKTVGGRVVVERDFEIAKEAGLTIDEVLDLDVDSYRAWEWFLTKDHRASHKEKMEKLPEEMRLETRAKQDAWLKAAEKRLG